MTVENMHRRVSIDLLKSVDCFTVRVPEGQKDPGHYGWDPKAMSQEKSNQNLHRVENSSDNLGLHLFNNVVDVDIDTDDPFTLAAIDYFLPHTPHIWGRKSKPRTHRLYTVVSQNGLFDPREHKFLSVAAQIDEIRVELRGGDQSNGQYSLLPGSIHPSGETYEWSDPSSARTTPIAIPLERLIYATKCAMVASLIARYFTEGQRHHLGQAFSGWMFRVGQHLSEAGSSQFFGIEEAKELMRGIMEISDDDPSDEHMRITSLEKTWEKAEAGTPVTGGGRIAEITGNEKLTSQLYGIFVESPEMERLDDFMRKYAVVRNSSEVICLPWMARTGVRWRMSHQEFKDGNMDQRIRIGDSPPTEMARLLLRSSQAIRVDGIGFNPEAEQLYENDTGLYMCNMWQGFHVQPFSEPVSENDIAPFIQYLREVISSNLEDQYAWVLAWVADIFQKPNRKPGTALSLVGKQGAGKSILGAKILRPIIGRTHSYVTSDLEGVVGKFNQDSAGKLIIQCDEALNDKQLATGNRLKALITDGIRRIEGKGVNSVQVEDYARLLLTSNHIANSAPVDADDRRYTIIRVSDKYAAKRTDASDALTSEEKTEYWREFVKWLEEEETLPKIMRFLMDHEYDERLIRVPLENEAKAATQQSSAGGIDEWLMSIVSQESPFQGTKEWGGQDARKGPKPFYNAGHEWPDKVSTTGILEIYTQFNKSRVKYGHRQDINEQQFRKEFIDRGLASKDDMVPRLQCREVDERSGSVFKPRKRFMIWPSKEKIAAYLRENFDYDFIEGQDLASGDANDIEGDGPMY